MRRYLLTLPMLAFTIAGNAQKIESLFFHLYTDSVKKSTVNYLVYNYINVDGKLSNGQWRPLTDKDVIFSASAGKFDGNTLILDPEFKGDKVTIKAVLKSDPGIWKEITVAIKKGPSQEKLKTEEEVFREPARKSKKNRKNSDYTRRA